MTEKQISKRELLKQAAYVAPAILTLKAVPSFARNGSGVTAHQGKKGQQWSVTDWILSLQETLR